MKWDGLQELQAQLRTLPERLKQEAGGIVLAAGERARARIYDAYGEKSGDLRSHLYVKASSQGLYGAGVLLVNNAKHAWLWDNGSEARHYTTKNGVRHATGRMWGKSSPPHTFVRIAMDERERMYEELADLLRDEGLTVLYGRAA